jgi:hypothetical protein
VEAKMPEQRNEDTPHGVKDVTVGAIKALGEVANAAIDSFGSTLVTALSRTRQVTAEATELISTSVKGIVKAAADTGQDVARAASTTVIGVVRATKEAGVETIDAVAATAGAIVKSTAEVGGNAAQAAKGAVEGAIRGAREVGASAEEAAQAAAEGAVHAARNIGGAIGSQVKEAVTETISGVKVILKEPFRNDKQDSAS